MKQCPIEVYKTPRYKQAKIKNSLRYERLTDAGGLIDFD